jgi:hypothetical protein
MQWLSLLSLITLVASNNLDVALIRLSAVRTVMDKFNLHIAVDEFPMPHNAIILRKEREAINIVVSLFFLSIQKSLFIKMLHYRRFGLSMDSMEVMRMDNMIENTNLYEEYNRLCELSTREQLKSVQKLVDSLDVCVDHVRQTISTVLEMTISNKVAERDLLEGRVKAFEKMVEKFLQK